MAFIEPGALEGLGGSTLFYPCAGGDLNEPLALFVPAITDYWFVDTSYFSSPAAAADSPEPSIARSDELQFERFELMGRPVAVRETRLDEFGSPYPFIEPCTRSEFYRHRASKSQVVVHRRRGFGQRSIRLVADIGVFFHRGDSPGEGGSNVHWLSNRWISEVLTRLRDGGLVVTDGSLAHSRHLRRFQGGDVSSEAAFAEAVPFSRWGRRWTCVGWAGIRYGPTLIWKTSAV